METFVLRPNETVLMSLPTGHQITLLLLEVDHETAELLVECPVDLRAYKGALFRSPDGCRGVWRPSDLN